jgi:hypothetical protein
MPESCARLAQLSSKRILKSKKEEINALRMVHFMAFWW